MYRRAQSPLELDSVGCTQSRGLTRPLVQPEGLCRPRQRGRRARGALPIELDSVVAQSKGGCATSRSARRVVSSEVEGRVSVMRAAQRGSVGVVRARPFVELKATRDSDGFTRISAA
eukprot:scaffold116039_cov27-Tisochrysis_lutea.AAC.1